MHLISIVNQKGGVGKTTTVTNLAYNLSRKKHRVLVVDCDPQGNASLSLGKVSPFEQARTVERLFTEASANFSNSIVPTRYERIDLIPCNLEASAVSLNLDASDPMRFIGFKLVFDEDTTLGDKYDFVLFDCPPSLDSLFLVNALTVSDYYIIPVGADGSYALNGVVPLLKVIEKIKKTVNKKLVLLGVLLTMCDARTKATSFVNNATTAMFGADNIFSSRIHRNASVSRANILNKSVCDFDDKSRGCSDYRSLMHEILERLEKIAAR